MLSITPTLSRVLPLAALDRNTSATRILQTCFGTNQLRVARDEWFEDSVAAEDEYGPIASWTFCSGCSFKLLFYNKGNFNPNLSEWDVGQVTDMSSMFHSASSFNGALSSWDVSKVMSMAYMFDSATSFDRELSGWDVGNVQTLEKMFHNAFSFNRDLSNWDVGKVSVMNSMFDEASSFNGSLSGWEVGNVTKMWGMFRYATSFNTNILGWDVRQVGDFSYMFYSTSSLKQCLELKIPPNSATTAMFSGSDGYISEKCQTESPQATPSIEPSPDRTPRPTMEPSTMPPPTIKLTPPTIELTLTPTVAPLLMPFPPLGEAPLPNIKVLIIFAGCFVVVFVVSVLALWKTRSFFTPGDENLDHSRDPTIIAEVLPTPTNQTIMRDNQEVDSIIKLLEDQLHTPEGSKSTKCRSMRLLFLKSFPSEDEENLIQQLMCSYKSYVSHGHDENFIALTLVEDYNAFSNDL